MVLPKEPVPGQKLDATWGRDVVRALKRLTPSGGPGMRVTCGPNGTTFAAVGRAAQAGATEQAAEAELLSFRIGVGVETIESGSSVTYKYHCVAVCADLMTDGVGYSEINTTVPDDSKLGGLPLGKAGSGLSWVWLKDADFADVTEESETSPTENVYLHIDRTRHLCVLFKDSCGERHVCGEGVLRVQGGTIPDAEDGPISSDGCFVQFPDGKWRKVTVFTDAAGEMSFLVEQDGFVSDDFADAPTQPYAYEKASGLYYALSGFIDEAGEAYLAISPDGVSGQAGAFALDPKTGDFTIASLPLPTHAKPENHSRRKIWYNLRCLKGITICRPSCKRLTT